MIRGAGGPVVPCSSRRSRWRASGSRCVRSWGPTRRPQPRRSLTCSGRPAWPSPWPTSRPGRCSTTCATSCSRRPTGSRSRPCPGGGRPDLTRCCSHRSPTSSATNGRPWRRSVRRRSSRLAGRASSAHSGRARSCDPARHARRCSFDPRTSSARARSTLPMARARRTSTPCFAPTPCSPGLRVRMAGSSSARGRGEGRLPVAVIRPSHPMQWSIRPARVTCSWPGWSPGGSCRRSEIR